MPKKGGRCQYEFWRKRVCNRKALPDSKYCICHEQRDDKDIKAFNKEIEKIMQDKDTNFYDFRGFYFPKNFNFKTIYKNLKDRKFKKKRADFRYAIFQKWADFNGATFQIADFVNAIFQKWADFNGATFILADFMDATFQGGAEFKGATSILANFMDATFQGGADFREAKFQVKADFMNAKFQKWADFNGAKFQEKVNFGGAVFQNTVDFSYYEEKNYTKFRIANFNHATFEKRADFENCEIEEKIDFRHAKFYDELSLTNIIGVPLFDFRNARFSDSTWIGAGTDLKNALFSLSRAELVDFTGTHFPEKIYEERLLEKKYAYKGLENEGLDEEEKEYCPRNWKEVIEIYRKLKRAHLKYGISDMAEHFGYREWEYRRERKIEVKSIRNYFKYLLYSIYKYWLGYGKRPRQLLYSAIILISLFSFFYWGTGLEIYNRELNKYECFDNGTASLERCFYFSVITFTTVGYGDIHPYGNWARRAAMIEAALGIFMMTFFVATFARRFV